MFKQALYTYMKLLHPRHIRKVEEPIWRTFLILWIFGPNWEDIQTQGISAWYTISVLLPMGICIYTNLSSKVNKPKAMFLVPMSKKDRKYYIKSLLCIKIGVPALVGVFIELLWGLKYKRSWVDLLLTAVIYVSFGISECICLQVTIPPGDKIGHGVRTANGKITYSFLNLANLAVIYVLLLGVTPAPVDDWEDPMILFGEAVDPVIGILTGIMLFLDMLILLRQFTSVLEENCGFEQPALVR